MLKLQQTTTGRGVVATQMLQKHATVCSYEGLVTRDLKGELEHYLLQIAPGFYLRPKKMPDPKKAEDFPWFINHSCKPNTKIKIAGRNAALIAIKHIMPGDQITFDYSVSQIDPWSMICMCDSSTNSCRQLIGPASSLPLYLKIKYLVGKTFPPYVVKTLF